MPGELRENHEIKKLYSQRSSWKYVGPSKICNTLLAGAIALADAALSGGWPCVYAADFPPIGVVS